MTYDVRVVRHINIIRCRRSESNLRCRRFKLALARLGIQMPPDDSELEVLSLDIIMMYGLVWYHMHVIFIVSWSHTSSISYDISLISRTTYDIIYDIMSNADCPAARVTACVRQRYYIWYHADCPGTAGAWPVPFGAMTCPPKKRPRGCAYCSKGSAHMPKAWGGFPGWLGQQGFTVKKDIWYRRSDILYRMLTYDVKV